MRQYPKTQAGSALVFSRGGSAVLRALSKGQTCRLQVEGQRSRDLRTPQESNVPWFRALLGFRVPAGNSPLKHLRFQHLMSANSQTPSKKTPSGKAFAEAACTEVTSSVYASPQKLRLALEQESEGFWV